MGIEQRLIGPPGTGKTASIAQNARAAAERYGADRVMVTSLTKAAALEAAGRELPLPPANVGTLHHFAYKALGRPTLAETVEGVRAWNSIAGDYVLSSASLAEGRLEDDSDSDRDVVTKGDLYLRELNLLRARMTPRDLWPSHVEEFEDAWRVWKEEGDRLDFADLIDLAYDEPCPIPGVRALFVDEAQDHDALEMRLIRRWAESTDVLTVVGDADQAIYDWRGADARVMSEPAIPESRRRVLMQSYRVPRAVHRVAQSWIQQLGDRREDVTFRPREEEGIAMSHPATYGHPEEMIMEATAHALSGRTVMVLASCGYMLEPTKTLLRRHGIPFANPYRRRRGDWNPLYAAPGRTTVADRIMAFLRLDRRTWGEKARFWTAEDLWHWCEWLDAEQTMLHGGKAAIRRRVNEDEGLGRTDLMTSDLLEWFRPEAVAAAFAGDVSWWREHMLARRQAALEYPLRIMETFGVGALREEPRLWIGTIHSVKGGEADVVYLCPDISQQAAEAKAYEGADGITRAFYVGMTRAREELYLTAATGESVSWTPALG